MPIVSYPVAPAITSFTSSLLDVAAVTDNFAWLDGADLFDSYNCMKFQATANFCAPSVKTFSNVAGWQQGFRFAAYGGVKCSTVGLDMARQESEVRRVFEAGESTAVERAMMATRFKANGTLWGAPVDITPAGGAVKPAVGVALLEGFGGDNYVGMPTIHMPRTIGSLLMGVQGAAFDGTVLQTKLGSKIAVGVGYDFPNNGPTGAAAPTGEKWIYATGEVVIGRSDVIVQQVVDPQNNDVYVLAERGYIAAVDCFAAAVRVQVTA